MRYFYQLCPLCSILSRLSDPTAALLRSLKSVHIEAPKDGELGDSSPTNNSGNHGICDLDTAQASASINGDIENSQPHGVASTDPYPPVHDQDQGQTDTSAWHSSSDFVQHSRESQAEDPFISPSRKDAAQDSNETPTPHAKVQLITSTPIESSKTPDHKCAMARAAQFTPREDRVGQAISVDNAQAMFPPTACVFVAK